MSDLICRKTMQRCLHPGMCSPHGGCRPDKSEWQSGYDEGRRMGVKTALDERDQLKAEKEALREDVENWKAVQRAMAQLKSDEHGAAIWSACSRILISLASDLNSVRSVVTEEGVTKDGTEIGDWRVTVERLAMAKERP